MSRKRPKPEEIVAKLRQADVLIGQGTSVAEAIRAIGVSEVTYDELLDGEIFYSLREAQILIESWRRHYNTVRPHGALGYRPPAPEVFLPAFTAWQAALTPPAPPAKRPVEQRPTVQ
ncbi:hypothetical protein OFEAOIEE_LOCUS3074 [Methylorubrum extorquens]